MLLQGTAGATAAFPLQLGNERRPREMQFLVYLTVLTVSISTVLLEVHWLASPEPRPNPAVQTRAVQAQKTEGSNAGVRTVYPKNPDPLQPRESDSQVQTTETGATGQSATNTLVRPPAQTTMTLPAKHPEPPASTPQDSPLQQPLPAPQPGSSQQPLPPPSAAPPQPSAQQSRAEATGAAVREENRRPVAYPANSSNGADNSQKQQATLGSSRNRCDIQACAGAYRSFRANDCTYQPFDGGARRLCEKSAGQRVVREREQPSLRKWGRDAEVRYLDHATVERRSLGKHDDTVDLDDFIGEPAGFLDFIFLGGRSR